MGESVQGILASERLRGNGIEWWQLGGVVLVEIEATVKVALDCLLESETVLVAKKMGVAVFSAETVAVAAVAVAALGGAAAVLVAEAVRRTATPVPT